MGDTAVPHTHIDGMASRGWLKPEKWRRIALAIDHVERACVTPELERTPPQ